MLCKQVKLSIGLEAYRGVSVQFLTGNGYNAKGAIIYLPPTHDVISDGSASAHLVKSVIALDACHRRRGVDWHVVLFQLVGISLAAIGAGYSSEGKLYPAPCSVNRLHKAGQGNC